MLIAGEDEAGRGPVIGPMVLGCVVINEKDSLKLKQLGVRDSKELSPQTRERLEKEIKKIAVEWGTRILSAKDIDDMRRYASLNEIEAMEFSDLLEGLKNIPKKVYIDTPDVKESNFAKRIRKYLFKDIELVCEHFADSKYPVCSAASIIAKVERDRQIKLLAEKYGKMGSGYPGDPDTIEFLNNWLKKNKKFPDFVRKSWDTAEQLLEEKRQRKLEEWL